MHAYVQSVLDFVSANAGWAWLFVALFAFGESLAVVGLFVPATVVLFGVGALVSTGVLDLWPIAVAAAAGAIAGDGVSYWLGYHYREQIRARWPFNRYPHMLESGENFIRRQGTKGVFFGRFIGPLRSTVPLIAGTFGLPPRKFWPMNVLSGVIWPFAFLLPGIAFGGALAVAGSVSIRLAILLVLVVAVAWLALWSTRYTARRGLPLLLAGQERLRRWAERHDNRAGRLVRIALDAERSDVRGISVLGVLLVLSAWGFGEVVHAVVAGDALLRANEVAQNVFRDLRSPLTDAVAVRLAALGDPVVTLAVAAVAATWLAWRRAWQATAYLLVAVLVAGAFVLLARLTLQQAEPGLAADETVLGFPALRVSLSVVVYGFLALLIARSARAWLGGCVIVAAGLVVSLVALAVLYLGGQWLTNVLGGIAFGLAWVALLHILYMRRRRPDIRPRVLSGLLAAALILVGGWQVATASPEGAADIAAAESPARTMPAETWWTGGWRELPVRRIDLEGELEEPLTVQWAGSIEALRDRLRPEGWREPEPWSIAGALSWLAPDPGPLDLPALPELHAGRLPSLTLVRGVEGAPDERLVLRVWPTDVAVRGGDGGRTFPVWVGGVERERLRRALWLVTFVLDDEAYGKDVVETLAAALRPENGATAAGGVANVRVAEGEVVLAAADALALADGGGDAGR